MKELTESEVEGEAVTGVSAPAPKRKYDMRRISYAETFDNPFMSATIRTIEWLTAKPRLLLLVRSFERAGSPIGVAFWSAAIRHMGIRIDTTAEEIAKIPKTGPVIVVANHPHGLVDGMIMAEIVSRVRSDFRILSRRMLAGIPEIEEFMIPVPFPHEPNAQDLGLQMREITTSHLKRGGLVIYFPAGRIAHSETWFGPAVEGEWHAFTHKLIRTTGATIVPIRFKGQNSRYYQIATKISATLRQSVLLYEIKRTLNKPQRPIIGDPIPATELEKWPGNTRGFLAWLREHTLNLTEHR